MAGKKKTAAKKAATKKKAGGGKAMESMADIEKRLAAAAVEADSREQESVGSYISTRGKRFTYKDAPLGEPLDVIVLGFSFLNEFYDTDYDPDDRTPPACYAVNMQEDDLVPPEDVRDRQAQNCEACPHNQFGSADKGKGKACGNKRRLAVMLANDTSADPQVVLLKLPPSALKVWASYVKNLAKVLQRPPYGVITRFTFDPTKDYPCPVPQLVEPIKNAKLFNTIEGKLAEAKEMLLHAIDTKIVEDEAPARGSKKKTAAKKKGGAKKKARARKF